MATDNLIISAYFNGTGMSFPWETSFEKLMSVLDEGIEKYDDDVEIYYKQTCEIETMMCEEAINEYMTPKTYKRVAEKYGVSVTMLAVIWFSNIKYLLKKGRIQTDNNFGFLSISTPNSNQFIKKFNKITKKNYQICGVCTQPANNLCSNCKKIYYCCKEHQRGDWKAHKKNCVA